MPGILRLGDRCSGHGCYPPRENIEGSDDVFADGLPVHRLGDAWAVHGSGDDCPPHSGRLASGSESVLTNGRPTGRIGDSVNCGSIAVTGSDTVFVD